MTDLTAATGTWVLDPAHTRFGFSAKHAMVSTVRGDFAIFSGTLVLDGADPARSSAHVEIDAASISTGNEQRDAHLVSPDFLDVANHPTITFASTRVRQLGDDEFEMVGDLTIRGVSRPVTITAALQGVAGDVFGVTKIGFEGRSTISRKDFDLTWNVALEAGGFLVGDKVTISLDVEADKQAVEAGVEAGVGEPVGAGA